MKAKVTSINNEPVKEEPVINPVPKETESKSGEEQLILKGSHSTWEKPTKEEMKQLNAAMAWKFIRLLLQSLAVFVSLSLMAFLRELDLPLSAVVSIALIGTLMFVIYYLEYRAPLIFGERYSPANDFKDNSLKSFGFGICCLLLAPFIFMCAFFWGPVCYIPAAIMAVLTYRKEFFMLMLFVLRKYTVKDGEVTWRRKYREYYHSDSSYRGYRWNSLTYTLDFADAEERPIPVLVDHYTYSKFKKNGKALLIYYRYGDSYMFEIIRLKSLYLNQENNNRTLP